ncbi:MAG: chemotaxis protein [bacterium]|nr:chemotaxis protein [bacterium]
MNSSSLSRSIFANIAAIVSAFLALGLFPVVGSNSLLIGMTVSMSALGYALFELIKARRAVLKVSTVCHDVGFGDFESRVLNINDAGEFGEMQHNVNHMIDRIDAFIREAQASTVAIAENKYFRRILPHGLYGFLEANATIINKATDIIQERVMSFEAETGEFKIKIDEIVEELADTSKNMIKASDQLGKGSTDTAARTQVVSTSAEDSSQNLQTISTAITELAASAKELSDHLSRSSSMTQQSVKKAKESRHKIAELRESTNRISQVIELIEDIADQTNLLALNATIEAARAGEAGKGFAVVAHEVKQLAQQSAKATSDITEQVNDIQQAMGNTVASIESISETIEELNDMTNSAASTVEEQSSATQEIAQSVTQVSVGTEVVSENIQSVSEIAKVTETMAGSFGQSATDLSNKASKLSGTIQEFMHSLQNGALNRKTKVDIYNSGSERREEKNDQAA